jgi:hypothetical protein
MSLSDFVLKSRVQLALVRDPRVSSLDISVQAEEGHVVLTGDVDSDTECRAAEAVAKSVDGVTEVDNQITCGAGARADTVEMVTQRFLEKLDEEWNRLPDQNALTQGDYLRWALWLIYKFRIPAKLIGESTVDMESDAMEQALAQVAGHVGAPKALLAMQMTQLADLINSSPILDAPEIKNAPLVSTPEVDGDPARAAA